MRAAAPLALVLAAASISGCAETYEQLAPFPCPRDHLCPEGLVCVSGVCDADHACTQPGRTCDERQAALNGGVGTCR